MIIFFQIFPNGPPHGIFIHPLVPQRKQEKLAKVSLWPKCHSGQSVTGQKVTSQCNTGQSVSPAKVSLWPKGHSSQNVIQPKIHTKEELKYSCKKALTTYARCCRLMRIESNLSLLPDGWFLVEFIKNY